MEDTANKINIINPDKGPTSFSFSEYFYNKIDLVPILEQSLEKMKKFIEFILSKLGKFCENKEEKQNAYLSEKIFDFMIDNSEKLGIVFFYQLLKEEKFINILINLFFEDIFIAQIKKLLEKIIYIFNIDYKHAEINNPLNSLYNDFINCGIIEQNDLKENEARESLTEEEKMFFELESSQILWEKYRKNGIEEDANNFLEDLLSGCEKLLDQIKEEEKLSPARIEYYNLKINEIKNFKNTKNKEEENKKNIKEKNKNIFDIDFNFENEEEEEEENEEIKTQEEIKDDIRELRKKSLKDRTYFYKDELIKEDEDEYIEYKNYYFPLKEKQKELERQLCAFLNTNGGRIYIGVNDKKMVKGVVTNKKLSFYESIILNLTKNFYPKIDPKDYFKFYALPIKNNCNGKILDNLYIFKIIIKRGDPTELYSIFDNNGLNIATRQAGQCPNLKASEIHEKIIERKNMKKIPQNHIINDDIVDFNDPEPLINKKIIKNENKKEILFIPKSKDYNWHNYYKKNNNKNNNNNKSNKNNNFKTNKNNKNKINNNNINYNNNINDNFIGFEKKKNKKKKKKNEDKNKQVRLFITNIDKNAIVEEMNDLFKPFKCKNLEFYENQDNKSAQMDFDKEADADDFINTFSGFTTGKNRIKLQKTFI